MSVFLVFNDTIIVDLIDLIYLLHQRLNEIYSHLVVYVLYYWAPLGKPQQELSGLQWTYQGKLLWLLFWLRVHLHAWKQVWDIADFQIVLYLLLIQSIILNDWIDHDGQNDFNYPHFVKPQLFAKKPHEIIKASKQIRLHEVFLLV